MFLFLFLVICIIAYMCKYKGCIMELMFKALSDKTRLELLLIISKMKSVCLCDLENGFDLSNSNLSRHLKELTQNSLLNVNKNGRWKFYSISDHGKKFMPLINSLLDKKNTAEINKKIKKIKEKSNC